MPPKARGPLAFLAVTVLIVANTLSGWPYSLRFVYAPLNGWVAALLGLSIPISIAFLGMAFESRIKRYVTLFIAILILLPALIFSCLAVFDNGSYELQDSLAVGLITYRVYVREPMIAIAQPYTILRKEIDTYCGIKLVHTIWADEHYGNALLRSIDNKTIEIEIDGDFFRKKIAI